MNDLLYSLEQTCGPLIQAIVYLIFLFLAAGCIAGLAFWSERRLFRLRRRVFAVLPLSIFAIGMLYGALRFSGQLLYSSDGWDPWGHWNYTNQNNGAIVLFLCACMWIGGLLAICREKFWQKH